MIEAQQNTIDGVLYHFVPLGAKASRAIYPRIVVEASKIVTAVALGHVSAFSTLDPNFVEFLHGQFVGNSRVDLGKGPVPLAPLADAHFGQKGALHESRWLLWMLECQYPDFLAAWKENSAKLLAAITKPKAEVLASAPETT